MSGKCFAVVETQRSVVVRPLDCDRTPVIKNEVATTAVVQPAEQVRHYTTFGGIPGRPGGNFPDVSVDGKLYGRQDESWMELGSAALADAGDFASQQWVLQQGFLTQHQSLAGYATETWVTNQGYVTTDTTYNNATTTVPGLMSDTDKVKLDGVEEQATKNATDAHLLDRANHTGTQAINTVTGLQNELDSKRSAYTNTTTSINKTLSNKECCAVTAGGLSITLPGSPEAGWEVVIPIAGDFDDTVIARNGAKIMGLDEDMTIDRPFVTVSLYYIDATRGWRII